MFTTLIPVAMFLFIKFFGTNKFDVPLPYPHGIPGCQDSPAHKSDFVYADEKGASEHVADIHDFVIYGLIGDDSTVMQQQIVELVRVSDAFYEVGTLRIVMFYEAENNAGPQFEKAAKNAQLSMDRLTIGHAEKSTLRPFLHCGIGLQISPSAASSNLVLVDPSGKIRGVYNSDEDAEIDRLIVELKILKRQ